MKYDFHKLINDSSLLVKENKNTNYQLNILLNLKLNLQCTTQYSNGLSHNNTMYVEISSDSGTYWLSQTSRWV